MEAQQISFKELFDTEATGVVGVKIPMIQRAYAQGRTDERTSNTRKNFLEAIHSALTDGKPLTLDFVYGNIADGILIPLDGQQRLTTLFLLHWYAAKRQALPSEDYTFLKQFSYATRYSARYFCQKLVDHTPSFDNIATQGKGGETLSDDIENQSWFPLDWKHDPTIASMLVMLNDIHHKFSDIEDLWGRLDKITFYFLSIDEMKQTDDIYIKMNSRGKPLTDFEHFKAELEKVAKGIDGEIATRIMHKIDREWTDMLWQYRRDENNPDDKNNDIIDDEFLRYFRFVCDIICYREGGSPKEKNEISLLDTYFKGDNAQENFATLERFFDCWVNCGEINSLFTQFLCGGHEQKKTMTRYAGYNFNLFAQCLHEYGEMQSSRIRKFTLNQTILLYAFIDYLQNKDSVSEKAFARRLRIIGNLVKNSSDEISDSENRTSGNRMPAILKQVDSIVIDGIISDGITIGENKGCPNFNTYQLKEEQEKLQFTEAHAELSDSLFTLEDHPLLSGQIGIVGIDRPELFPVFAKLFECDWDLIDCALLSIGNYSQRLSDWRIQMGSSGKAMRQDKKDQAWKNLFHWSRSAKGYEQTRQCLIELLSRSATPSDEFLRSITDDFLNRCERECLFDWRYYYVKYESFRHGRYGKYNQQSDKPYEMIALHAELQLSANAYQVFLNEIKVQTGIGELDQNNCGERLKIDDKFFMYCYNDAYVIKDATSGEELSRLPINQIEGTDMENRVLRGAEYLKSHVGEVENT